MKKDLLEICNLSTSEIDDLITLAKDIIKNPDKYREHCKNKKIATLFYEPSTRTRFSFESAMLDLGGTVVGFSSPTECSVAKGESVADTARTVECFADIIAIRHFKEGAAYVAATNVDIPVINAGDGGHHHPTQTLADLLTIYTEKKTFENLTIGLCGDLKYGRTVHSLVSAMKRYKGTKFYFISPTKLKMPEHVMTALENCNIEHIETAYLEEAMPELDVLYMTRIQRERFSNQAEYIKLKGTYILDSPKLEFAKEDLCIMHPLPRVDEIAVEVDADPRAAYFRQVKNGKFIRMALIIKLLEATNTERPYITDATEFAPTVIKCRNTRCISSIEQGLTPLFIKAKTGYRCIYCDCKAR
ncbi:MAG: aspartate carbamoyltransferase [Ruminococcaceae bacterium]|nr:aspartate carbamoyltransferase [Oscillospiraceae bacterium]